MYWLYPSLVRPRRQQQQQRQHTHTHGIVRTHTESSSFMSWCHVTQHVLLNFDDFYTFRYTQFNDLKTKNPGLKTLLAVGGWNAGSTLFSNMAHSATDRQNFAKQTTQFLRKWNFDGFDLDWEYPTQRDGSRPTDRERFIDLIDVRIIFGCVARFKCPLHDAI